MPEAGEGSTSSRLPASNCGKPEECPLAQALSCLVHRLDAKVTALADAVDALMDLARHPPAEVLHFEELTAEQITKICNGCGGKGSFINPPDWIFEADCDRHDFAYWRGGNEDDRRRADKGFYAAMKRDVHNRLPPIRQWMGYTAAWIYYRAVRLCGKKFFYYTSRQRGRADLARLASTKA